MPTAFPTHSILWTDGYSGVTFDRPGYKAMMAQVEAGNVSSILVKEHFRLGRNRLVVGILLEETFASYNVRYIAINDNVDTLNGVDNSVAVRDLFNEWHARDNSKKVKAVIMAAARRIFALCASGLGPDKIARILRADQILTPLFMSFAPTVSAIPI